MKRIFLYFAVLVLGIGLFQNCGQGGFQTFAEDAMTSLSTTGVADTNHPSVADPTPKFDSYTEPLINKLYIARVIREVFGSHDGDVDGRLFEWVNSKGANFGIGCNAYDTMANKDCGGDALNANASVRTPASTMRALYHLRICSEIIGLDGSVDAALAKTGRAPGAAVTTESVKDVYQLFYRIEEPDAMVTQLFIDLDAALAAKGVVAKERWRAILISICDSPGWQQF